MVYILDHIDNIVYDPSISTIKNCHPLTYLPNGIITLAHNIRSYEIKKKQDEIPISASFLSFSEQDNFIACAFHWFSTSFVNYCRLIAFVEVMSKNGWMIENLSDNSKKKIVKKHCTDYVKRVIPEVRVWRNKVAAHFSSTDPLGLDNIGTLQDSMMYPVAYIDPYYYAHVLNYAKGDEKSNIPQWSLTKVYEDLSKRYFPNDSLPEIPEKGSE